MESKKEVLIKLEEESINQAIISIIKIFNEYYESIVDLQIRAKEARGKSVPSFIALVDNQRQIFEDFKRAAEEETKTVPYNKKIKGLIQEKNNELKLLIS